MSASNRNSLAQSKSYALEATFSLLFTMGWLTFKCAAFNNWLYRLDISTALDVSRNIFYGRWIWWSNLHGWAGAGHHFIFNILIGPLVLPLGAYALFLITAALILFSGIYWVRALRSCTNDRLISFSLTFFLLFGPVSFWLFDDIYHGWHVDQLYVPLGMMLLLDTLEGKRTQWFWGLLIAICREDGAIVAFAIHSLAVIAYPNRRKLVWGVWSWIFILNLFVLWVSSPLGSSRFQQSLQTLTLLGSPDFALLILTLIGQWLTMIGTLLIPFFRFRPKLSLSHIVPLILLLMGHTLACSFANWPFSNMLYNGSIFPSHFAAGWAFAVAYFLYGLLADIESTRRHLANRGFVLTLICISIAIQSFALYSMRGYRVVDRFRAISSENMPYRRAFSARTLDSIACLSNRVQRDLSIKVSEEFYPPFHLHELVNLGRIEDALTPPEIVLCVTGDYCRSLIKDASIYTGVPSPTLVIEGEQATIAIFTSLAMNQASECLRHWRKNTD